MNQRRGRLGSYALWQARDYFFNVPGVGSFILPFMLGLFPMLMMRYIGSKHGIGAAEMENSGKQAFDLLISSAGWIGPMLSVTTMVSADRSPGITRFIFSKPVSVSAYYLQMWLVRGVSLALITLALGLTANIFVAHMPWAQGIAAVAVAWVLIGGVGMLFSVLTARDGLLLIIVYLAANAVDGVRKSLPDLHWPTWVLYVLPPMQKLEVLRHAFLRGTPVSAGDLWHVVLYGAGCAALATYLVRRLPLVR